MESSLQNAELAIGAVPSSLEVEQETEEEHSIHLPNPSLWPLMLGAAILVAMTGLLFIPDNPWLLIVAAPFILLGILGWALEDPMGTGHGHEETGGRNRVMPGSEEVLDQARATVERFVTFSSTAYSTHPIKVDIENTDSAGTVLSVYGKVELQAQREELYDALIALPGVAEVKNFVVAEDEILNMAYTRVDALKSQGKLDGTSNIEVLVENYILHLYGDVPNTKMKYTLERDLIGIPGVRVVVNHIGLNKEIPGNLGKTANKVGV